MDTPMVFVLDQDAQKRILSRKWSDERKYSFLRKQEVGVASEEDFRLR